VPTPEITIRRALTIADYHACQRAQRAAWGIDDESYVVPVATMVGAQYHGGLVLGAFLPDGEAAGMSFAFLGRESGGLCLYSQLTGVVPGFQDQGLGYRMKMFQRDFARAERIPCIAWAFDPLQAGNARFNLERLGATAARYVVDMYGPRTDALNRATATDRLIAVWETAPALPRSFSYDMARDMQRLTNDETVSEPIALLEIPLDVNRLRRERREEAEAWGRGVRQAFLAAFSAGYRAVGFVRDDAETTKERRGFYVLERGSEPPPISHVAPPDSAYLKNLQ
jgi:predicted GNAT superfamily acetyltransferase